MVGLESKNLYILFIKANYDIQASKLGLIIKITK